MLIQRCCILAVLMAGIAAAQASDAEITGIAKDPSAAPIASANVTLVNQDSGFTRTVTTDADGRYRFVALPQGTYTIKVEATGFKTDTITGIVLHIGTHVDRDVSLTDRKSTRLNSSHMSSSYA